MKRILTKHLREAVVKHCCKTRIILTICILLTILSGLYLRTIKSVPNPVGDGLWAIMIFLIIRWMLINIKLMFVAIYSLGFCYFIEATQLYKADWIVRIRGTLPGRLVLGQGFMWMDIVAYTVGIIIVYSIYIVIVKSIERA